MSGKVSRGFQLTINKQEYFKTQINNQMKGANPRVQTLLSHGAPTQVFSRISQVRAEYCKAANTSHAQPPVSRLTVPSVQMQFTAASTVVAVWIHRLHLI